MSWMKGVRVHFPMGPQRQHLIHSAEALGATFVADARDNCIVLLTDDQIQKLEAKPPQQLNNTRIYSIKALHDAIDRGEWHSKEVLEDSYKVKFKGVDPITGRQVQKQLKKKQRFKYTRQDDGLILHYLQEVLETYNGKEIPSLAGHHIWKEVYQRFVAPSHSAESMRERYLKRLKDVSTYEQQSLIRLVRGDESPPPPSKRRKVDDEDQEQEEDIKDQLEELVEEADLSTQQPIKQQDVETQPVEEEEELLSVEEVVQGIEIIRRRYGKLADKELTHALMASSGDFVLALEYLKCQRNGQGDHERHNCDEIKRRIWTPSMDHVLLNSTAADSKEKIKDLIRHKGKEDVFRRVVFLQEEEDEE
jgi:hypothetical protein